MKNILIIKDRIKFVIVMEFFFYFYHIAISIYVNTIKYFIKKVTY